MEDATNLRPLWVWRLFAVGYALFIHLGRIFVVAPEWQFADLIPRWDSVWFYAVSLVLLGVMIAFPTQLYLYAFDCCFQALLSFAGGGIVVGVFLYLLGCTFAYRQGFFAPAGRQRSSF